MVVSKHVGKSCYMWFSVVTTEENKIWLKWLYLFLFSMLICLLLIVSCNCHFRTLSNLLYHNIVPFASYKILLICACICVFVCILMCSRNIVPLAAYS